MGEAEAGRAAVDAPRRRQRIHRSDPLPPPTRENWLGLGLMVAATVSMPVSVYGGGFPPGISGQVSLVPMLAISAFYLFLGVGMWLVRPHRGHGTAYRVAFVFLHLQAACYLLMWSQSWWGGLPDPFRPRSPYAIAATFFTVLGFVPAFLLRKRSREWTLLFWVEVIVPFFVAVALAWGLLGWIVVSLR